jgi:hypothetical protein
MDPMLKDRRFDITDQCFEPTHLQLLSLALNVGEVEEDLLVMLQSLNESEAVFQGSDITFLRSA